MSPFKKNLQRFLTLFFTAISIVIVVMGIVRTKKTPDLLSAGITPDQNATPLTDSTTSASPQNVVAGTGATVDTATSIAFSGASYQTPWGNASASIQVKNGRVVAVTMPQVPQSPPSQYAEQFLIQQALEAGSANIQGVSGATFTSLAFKSSLESAIAKAKTQGQTVVAIPASATSGASKTTVRPAKPAVPRRYREDDENDW